MADYIDFDDKAKTRNTLIKWICLEMILLVCYQAYPLVGKFSKNRIFNDIKIFKLSMHRTLAIILIALAAAICEEILFLGILFNICLVVFRKNKYNLLWTSILTSIFFGLMHLINLGHQPLVAMIGQIIFAMALGLVFSYLRIT